MRALMARLEEHQVTITARGANLLLDCPVKVPDELIEQVRQHKQELLTLVRRHTLPPCSCVGSLWRFYGEQCPDCDGAICGDCNKCIREKVKRRGLEGL